MIRKGHTLDNTGHCIGALRITEAGKGHRSSCIASALCSGVGRAVRQGGGMASQRRTRQCYL